MTEDEQGERLADAYDLDLKAAGLREAADAWENLGQPVQRSPIGVWLRARADQLERDSEQLRNSVPTPILCQILDVDGQAVRLQAAPGMPDQLRDALTDLVRTVQRNHATGTRQEPT